MSLSVIVMGPEGLVFAAESRSLMDLPLPNGTKCPISFDATNKLLTFDEPHNFVAAVTYGLGGIGSRSIYSFMPELEAALAKQGRLAIDKFAKKLSDFFMSEWNKVPELKDYKGVPITFLVGGFNKGELYNHTYEIQIPSKPEPTEIPPTGIRWGGQIELVDRLMKGYDPNLPTQLSVAWSLSDEQVKAMPQIAQSLELSFPLYAMGLQGCVDLAVLLIRTTIETQRLSVCVRGCGGLIDVATITRKYGLRYVQRKQVEGELF
jgi:hypothetical protein